MYHVLIIELDKSQMRYRQLTLITFSKLPAVYKYDEKALDQREIMVSQVGLKR